MKIQKAVKGVNMKYNNVIFDNWNIYEPGEPEQTYWCGICEKCYTEHKSAFTEYEEDNCGSGTCDVKGCDGEASYYLDLVDNHISFIKEDIELAPNERRAKVRQKGL